MIGTSVSITRSVPKLSNQKKFKTNKNEIFQSTSGRIQMDIRGYKFYCDA